MVQSSRAIDKDCGSIDDLLPALIMAVTIYFKGLGHHMKTSSVSLIYEKQLRGIIKCITSFILYCEFFFYHSVYCQWPWHDPKSC